MAKTQFRPPATAVRYRPPQKKNQAKTGFKKAFTVPLQRAPQDQGILLFHQLTGPARIVVGQVIGPSIVLILRRIIRSRGILVLVKVMLTTPT